MINNFDFSELKYFNIRMKNYYNVKQMQMILRCIEFFHKQFASSFPNPPFMNGIESF